MTVSVSTAYAAALRKGSNQPVTIIEVTLDTRTLKWGDDSGGFDDVQPILKSVSSLQNKINASSGFTTRGNISVVISGREAIRSFVAPTDSARITESGAPRITEDGITRIIEQVIKTYINNRRVSVKDGLYGMAYTEYAEIYSGKITNWSRSGDELTLIISDDLEDTKTKLPVENARKTQYLNYQAANPADIILDVLSTQLAISSVYVDSTQFTTERDAWLNSYKFDRVLTKPITANQIISELQAETNSFVVHDGNKIGYKVFAPLLPNQTVETWSDNNHILDNSLSQDSGYSDQFYNRVIVQYDYDESDSEEWENFESIYISQDSSSLSTSEWNETNTKYIKSKWMRSFTYTQPSNITGVNLYHVSIDNGLGAGTLTFTTGATAHSLTWTAPNSTAAGVAAMLNKAGRFQLFDSDTSKSVRAIVETSSLPLASTSDTITISQLNGGGYAASLADRTLARYRDPVSSIKFDVDINDAVYSGNYLKPGDVKQITTDEAFDFSSTSWAAEPIMITSVRKTNGDKLNIEAIQTKLYKNYGFIAPAGYPDYTSATDAQKEFAFIADSSGKLSESTSLAYYQW